MIHILLGLWRVSLTVALFAAAGFSYLAWQDVRGDSELRTSLTWAAENAADAAYYALRCIPEPERSDALHHRNGG
jgi:hypothetical protein